MCYKCQQWDYIVPACKTTVLYKENKSVVSPVSKRYMRAGIGNERLVVCLSEYLPLRIVYRISSMSTIA